MGTCSTTSRPATPTARRSSTCTAGRGPGALLARQNFDSRATAVLLDQRSAGLSTPHASEEGVHWASIDMDHHVADIEQLREHLGIDRWIVFGISWGSVLGATYAERHPDRVSAVVLAAVSPGTADDIDWIIEGCRRYFPAEWQAFHDHVPPELRHLRLVDAYNTLLMDPDVDVRRAAASAWCTWEDTHMGGGPNLRYADPGSGSGSPARSRTAGATTRGSSPMRSCATPIGLRASPAG